MLNKHTRGFNHGDTDCDIRRVPVVKTTGYVTIDEFIPHNI